MYTKNYKYFCMLVTIVSILFSCDRAHDYGPEQNIVKFFTTIGGGEVTIMDGFLRDVLIHTTERSAV